MTLRRLFAVPALLSLAMAQGAAAQSPKLPDETAIAEAARAAMAKTGARGLAIAVIDEGAVKSVQAFGERNAEGEPLTVDTVMYGASLTKAMFGYLVMQLVDEGKVDLDKPIAAMLPKPIPSYGNIDAYGNWGDLADDPRWADITPRMVLNHATGFANFAYLEPDEKLRIHFDPGTRYAYSGEGIELLQFGLEVGLGLDVEAELKRRFFDPLGMTNSSLIWQPHFAANMADGWTETGEAVPHDDRSRVRAAGSLDTSIADLAKFAAFMARGADLSPEAAAERVRPGLPIRSYRQFPSLQPDAPPEKQVPGLAAGIGVVTFTGPQGPGWYKGGHNETTGNQIVCLTKQQRCVLILSNDVRAEGAFDGLVRSILGETGVPFQWEYRGSHGF